MNNSTIATPPGRRIVPFLVAQLLIVGVAVAGVTYRSYQLDRRVELPPLRNEPLEIRPLYDLGEVVVSDDQLRTVLKRLRPQFYGQGTRVAVVDHDLRCWGWQAKFNTAPFASGEELRRLLTDHRRFQLIYGEDEKPLLIDVEGGGVRYREFEGKASSSHDDHTMACLAEVGTSLDFPIFTPQRETDFRAVVEQSLRDFRLNQAEYEWSTLTYALFLKDNRWVTSEGQEVTFDRLADRIMRQEMPQGVCAGNHRLHALVMFLRVDEMWDGPTPLLSNEMRDEIIAYLQGMTAKLIQHQHPQGFWNSDWPTATPATDQPTDRVGDRLSERIIATGHALEWWALAPKEVHPPRHVIVSASQWLVRTVENLNDDEILFHRAFLSHAVRAMTLWRGKYPHQVPLSDME